jgi:lysyl-tRNA synthetase, class II
VFEALLSSSNKSIPDGQLDDSVDAQGLPIHATATHERRSKAERLRAQGVDPFPHVRLPDRTKIAAIYGAHDPAELGPGEHAQLVYCLAGRLMAKRGHSKTTFLDIRDATGTMQAVVREETLGAELYERMLHLDLGDIVSITGCIYVTKRGQLSLCAHECTLLTKALRLPPAKYHGVEDLETRYRYRELDLMANDDTRELFHARAKMVVAIRDWMARRAFTEIETPVLQPLAGGAAARPFVTHQNALAGELHMRISVELYLNRCTIGGLEDVYELAKCFRNEGFSYKHSPEFTMLEWMQSYADYTDVAAFTEEMVTDVARAVLGGTEIQWAGEKIDLAKPWRRVSMRDAIKEVTGLDIASADLPSLIELVANKVAPDATWAQAVHIIYSKLVEPTLIQPTLVFDFPVELFPITNRHATEPQLAEHFDAVIGGIELVSGDTELTDPDEQWERFVDQRKLKRSGDDEDMPHPHDTEYVRSLQHGLAPSASGGMGVDRLLMILTGHDSIREVVPFPILREQR